MTTPLPTELSALARIRSTQLSDYVIQLAYLTANGQWDSAAMACVDANLALNQLAGCISQILPVSPCPDAPPIPQPPHDG